MVAVGIDLGTTNSLCAIVEDDGARLIPNALGSVLTPSAVGLDDDGKVLVGQAARDRLLTHAKLTTHSFKRHMGSKRKIPLGDKVFLPEELSALVLQSLKKDAEAFLTQNGYDSQAATEAVISVPAYFNDTQRNATLAAAELAGITVLKLINEPTAASIAYGLYDRDEDSQFIVLDLGGGTFDVSLLELFEEIIEVHASAGDNYLGGEDFTQCIVDDILADAHLQQTELSLSERNKVYLFAEQIKRQLSSSQEFESEIQICGSSQLYRISRERLEHLTTALVQRMTQPITQALRDSAKSTGELDEVILVGGATRMPLIRSAVAKLFKRLPNTTIDAETVVAQGAAVQAALVKRQALPKEVVLTDVAPYTLGVEICELHRNKDFRPGFYLPIIERNSRIPTSRAETLHTVENYQKVMRVVVYQGESRLVENNIKLGELSIKLATPAQKEDSVEIRYTYNVNGLLEVQCTVLSTGHCEKVVIQNQEYRMSDAEIQASLEKLNELKIHPREQLKVRAAMAQAERLYETSLADRREFIKALIQEFETVLDSQNLTHVEERLPEFIAQLDQLENESVW